MVLDNFEHIMNAAPQLTDLAAACPRLKIIATSRSPLHLSWEHEFPVRPLPVPDLHDSVEVEKAATTPAIALFVQRARAVRPDFVLTKDNLLLVAEICARSDGLPLAIELAAGQVKTFSLQSISANIQHALDVTNGAQDLPARHHSIHASIAWSYDLLTPTEQSVFRRLSYFKGGFSSEAAVALAFAGENAESILTNLASLVDRSLVHKQDQVDGSERFSMLETIREYGFEKLSSHADVSAVSRAYALYFANLADRIDRELRGPERHKSFASVEVNLPNIRAAMEWAFQSGEADIGLRLTAGLSLFWFFRGDFSEAQAFLERGLATEGELSPLLRGRSLCAASLMAWMLGDYDRMKSLAKEALRWCSEAGDRWWIALALHYLGLHAAETGDLSQGKSLQQRALGIAQELGDAYLLVTVLNSLGVVLASQGESAQAMSAYEDAVRLVPRAGDPRILAYPLKNLAGLESQRGKPRRAKVLLERALELVRDARDQFLLGSILIDLGRFETSQRNHQRACAYLLEGLRVSGRMGQRRQMAACFEASGILAYAARKPIRSARLLGAAEGLRLSIGAVLPGLMQKDHDRAVKLLRRRLSGQAFEPAWAEGRALTLDEAIEDVRELDRELANSARSGWGLTAREREVAHLISQGLSNRAIASKLKITEGTTESHVQHILNKLGYSSRAQIAAWAISSGVGAFSQSSPPTSRIS